MKNKSKGEIVRFAVVGTSNFVIIMLVANLLDKHCGVNFYVANAIAYVLAFVNNFYWNRVWVFKSVSKAVRRQFVLFLVAYAVAYLVQLATVALLKQVVGVDERLANFIGLFPFGATNFLMNKFLTFQR